VNGLPKQPVLYEAMYILDSALEESAVEGIANTLEEHVRAHGGEVIATREFGRRRLAFEIDGHTSGTYMVLYFKSHGDVVDEVTHEMHLTDGIVRGIVVVANPKAIFEPQAQPEPEAAAEEPDMALAEATTEGVSAGEAGAESAAGAEAEAEAEEAEEVAETEGEVAGEAAAVGEPETEQA
jgi:small subunit ribosomal protein S6